MIKSALLYFFLIAFVCTNAQSKVPSAAEVLKPVYAQAKKENKNVLLIYHASWCVWCRKMDSSLQDKNVMLLIDRNYVTAHLTVYESKDKKELENEGANALLTKHGGAEKGLPFWVILDSNGNLLANSEYKPNQNSGCPATKEEVAYFITVLKKTSSLNEDELKVVSERFRSNEMVEQ